MDDVQIEENIDLIGVEELGYRFQTPVSASKRAVLLSYVSAILVIILSVGWFIFAAYTATKLMMLTELISLLLGICVLFLLKKGFISFAKHLLIIGLLSWMVATIVILSGPGGAERGGVHFFLIPISAGCIILFSDSTKFQGLFYAVVSFVIFLFTEYNIIPFEALAPIPEAARIASHIFVVSGSFLAIIVLAGVFVADMSRTERLFQTANDWLERLLKRVLPPKIVDKLRSSEKTFAERIDECTILFADIVGFTDFCRKNSAVNVVATLSKIFSKFDDLAREHGIEKIKTIGDAYMAASGVPESRTDHAIAIAYFALDLRDWMSQFDGLEVRIGIHSGSVIAGLIGKDRFVYDLWGDSVNIASRMESTGEKGIIQISKETSNLLTDDFSIHSRGFVNAKGIGKIEAYCLER